MFMNPLLEQSTPLPFELIRDILELAASSDLGTAKALINVSSLFRHWTLPIMYHTVVLSSTRAVARFHETISVSVILSSPPLFKYVRNLAIFTNASLSFVGDIITMCSHIRTLACDFPLNLLHQWYKSNDSADLPPVREQHLLGISCRDSFDRFFLVPTTTHLHMQLVTSSIILLDQMKERFSSLTHLAITFVFPPPHIFKSLAPLLRQLLNSETLQVLLIQDASLAGVSPLVDAINQLNQDERLVAIKIPQSPLRQWKDRSTTGTPLLWRKAEAEVYNRKVKNLSAILSTN